MLFRILVIDDDPKTLLAIESALNSPDYEIITANSGQEALRYLLHKTAELVLLDVRMSDMDGYETAALIRDRKQTANLPIIFMSAIDKTDSRVFKGYQAGAIDYLFKPVNPAILKAKVAVFADLFNARRQLEQNNLSLENVNKELKVEIGERKRAEERLREYQAQLESLVNIRTAQLQQVNEQLKEDVAQRRQAQEALIESEERYRRFFEDDLTGDFVANADSEIVMCNPAFLRIFGFATVDDALGKSMTELVQDPFRWRSTIQLLVSRRTLERYECDYVRRDGSLIHVVQNLVADFDPDNKGQMTRFKGYIFDDTARKHAQERLEASLAEKEVLLREIHHRVKNNLQVVSSLINLESRNSRSGASPKWLEDLRDRVHTMALAHEQLYRAEDLSKVDFTAYAKAVLQNLWRAHSPANGRRLELALELEPLSLSVDKALPCGLILNELVSNSLEHAFPDRDQGTITVRLRISTGGRDVCMAVGDNGIGLPVDLDLQSPCTLGLRLIQMLTSQLNGALEIRREQGTEFQIKFKKEGRADLRLAMA